jgi:hypothetical protein
MQIKHWGLGVGVVMLIVFLLFIANKDDVGSINELVANSTEDITTSTTKQTDISALIEADVASAEPRTLEITGWKKLPNDSYLNESYIDIDLTKLSVGIWIPSEWFIALSYNSGGGSSMPVYHLQRDIEYTQNDRDLFWKYAPELSVARIGLWNQGSRVLSLNQESLKERESVEYASFEDEVTIVNISGVNAKKVIRTFMKEDGTRSKMYSIVFEDMPTSFRFIDISVYDKYTNTEEIFNEIVNRIEIK